MQRTRRILIGLLLLANTGCAKRDWVDLLVLTDVTGSWEGTARMNWGVGTSTVISVPITLVLQQSGPKVTGELSWSRGQQRVEGVVNGEALIFREGIRVELAVDGDEMWGTTQDPLFTSAIGCKPCLLIFRRASAPGPASSEPPARRGP